MLEFANFDISKVSGLSLVISLSIAKVLQKMSLESQIKWPNDIFVNDKKIAGVIINATAEFNDRTKLFIGFGINVNMLDNATLGSSWTSIQKESGLYIDRTTLLIEIIKTIKSDIKIFYNKGLDAFIENYENINYLKNKKFELNIATKNYKNCRYIALSNNGEIILDIDDNQRTFSSGEISLSDSFIKDE
jgi:BirA family biotin operon repressor/biotin-[acetyl-CoA-carboxylase] ligase